MDLPLTRCRNANRPAPTGQIIRLLKTLGVPRQMLYVGRWRENKSFWLRNINHLEVLEQARGLYRSQMACVHPDKSGGSLEQAVRLNLAWGQIEQRFKQHGHELW